MLKLATILFVIIAPSLMGIAVVGLLTMDIATSSAKAVMTAAGLGALVAIPVSVAVASVLSRRGRAASTAFS